MRQYIKHSRGSARNRKKYKLLFRIALLALLLVCITYSIYLSVNTALRNKGTLTQTQTQAQTQTQTTSEISTPAAPATETQTQTDWKLMLVNTQHPLPQGFTPELTEIEKGYQFDARAAEALKQMLADCEAAGLQPLICSAYRSVDTQQRLFEEQVQECLSAGAETREEAERQAATVVTLPGESEHNLGLAADIVDKAYQVLDEGQEDTGVFKWLKENCSSYGFILRYPQGKTDITGIIYEPWHFRYVGIDAAKEITQQGICLEEYLQNVEEN